MRIRKQIRDDLPSLDYLRGWDQGQEWMKRLLYREFRLLLDEYLTSNDKSIIRNCLLNLNKDLKDE